MNEYIYCFIITQLTLLYYKHYQHLTEMPPSLPAYLLVLLLDITPWLLSTPFLLALRLTRFDDSRPEFPAEQTSYMYIIFMR